MRVVDAESISTRGRLGSPGPGWLGCLVLVASSAVSGATFAADADSDAKHAVYRCLILATSNSESNFDGGKLANGEYLYPVARVAAVKERELAKNPDGVLLVDTGDILAGRYMERADGNSEAARGQAWDLYAYAGYNAVGIGEKEFDAGPAHLDKVLNGQAAAPRVPKPRCQDDRKNRCHDFFDQDTDTTRYWSLPAPLYSNLWFMGRRPWVHMGCGEILFRVSALLTPAASRLSNMAGVRIEDPATALRKSSPGPLPLVVLSHLGLDEAVQLAHDVTRIDVIIGGHGHHVLSEAVRVGRTYIGQAGSQFSHLAFWELTLINGKLSVKYHLEPIDEHMPIDKEVKKAVDELRRTLLPEVIVGRRKTTWDLAKPGQSAYATMATRAVWRYATKAAGRRLDGALLNTGSFRTARLYPPGPVTNLEVRGIHPVRGQLVVVKLTGAQLKDALEQACAPPDGMAHEPSLVSWGVSFTCDMAKPKIEFEMRDDVPAAVRIPGQRTQALVGGKPLDMQRVYEVATLDYLAHNGSRYLGVAQGTRKCLDGKDLVEGERCAGAPDLHGVVEAAVKAGTLEQTLQ